jgi:tripartite-type tricarboxylate transporter receptor subunit TctC
VSSWNALALPAATPTVIVARLHREIQAALAAPEVQQQLNTLSVRAQASSPEQASELLRTEVQRWGEVIARAHIARQ